RLRGSYGLRGPSPLPERADRLPQVVGYFVTGYPSLAPEGRGNPPGCLGSSISVPYMRAVLAAHDMAGVSRVRQRPIALITVIWPRLTWPILAPTPSYSG